MRLGGEVSSAGVVLRGHRGCHRPVGSLGMRHGRSCLQHSRAGGTEAAILGWEAFEGQGKRCGMQ